MQGRGPGDRVESPYDIDARFRSKSGTSWTGYMVHLTETCDAGAPRLVVHADTTPANVHEALRTAPIHDALAAKGLAPSEHLVDSAYVSADHLVAARERHGIDLVGPGRPNLSWQSRSDGGRVHAPADFTVDWDRQVVRCPEGMESTSWGEYTKRQGGGPALIRVQFRAGRTAGPAHRAPAAPERARSTRAARAAAAARARSARGRPGPAGTTEAGRRLYAQRQGVEGTISQAVRAFGLRRARYRGLAKTGLQHVATAAALNLDRLGRLVRQPPARADPHLALRRARRLSGDFANGIRPFPGQAARSPARSC